MNGQGNTVGSQESLSHQQQAIVVGKILGDGCLEMNGCNARLKIEQCARQKPYVFWLYEQLKPLVGRSPRMINYGGGNRKKTVRWRFSTLSRAPFTNYYHIFYQRGKKIIPSDIKNLITTPLTLAIWYMDDGYLRSDQSGAYLCTSSFTEDGQHKLRKTLEINYQLETNLHYAGKYARLHIPSRCKDRFFNMIDPYILDCFKYKLSLTP